MVYLLHLDFENIKNRVIKSALGKPLSGKIYLTWTNHVTPLPHKTFK